MSKGFDGAVFWITRSDLLRAEHEGDNVVACPAVGGELPEDAVLLYLEPRQLAERVSSLEAARIAYASEFPLNDDGEPDVGNIHANIRQLASQRADLLEALQNANAFIEGLQDDLHKRRVADWYPEGANNAALQMSEDMRLLGNECANFDTTTADRIANATQQRNAVGGEG